MKSELVEEFLEKNKEKYESYEYVQSSLVCRYPFKYIKKMMASEDIPDIRIQYFGIFRPLKKRLKGMLAILKKKLDNKIISQEDYNKNTTIINRKLNETDKEI